MLDHIMQDVVATERIENTAIVTLQERMDVIYAPVLMRELNALVEAGVTRFVIDLTAVRIVDADGDYPLLHLLKRSQTIEGDVILVCPEGNPVRLFYEMMHLDTLFDIVGSLEMAKAELGLPI
ncbi:MAG: STAS domain-containing protein [Anaerolineae bacterium]